jgi:hypothetical protein
MATLFLIFSQCSAGRFNAVGNAASSVDKVSDRELGGTVYVQTRVTRDGGALETRERGVFQVDTFSPIAGHCRIIPKRYCGVAEESHAITDAPTDCTAVK